MGLTSLMPALPRKQSRQPGHPVTEGGTAVPPCLPGSLPPAHSQTKEGASPLRLPVGAAWSTVPTDLWSLAPLVKPPGAGAGPTLHACGQVCSVPVLPRISGVLLHSEARSMTSSFCCFRQPHRDWSSERTPEGSPEPFLTLLLAQTLAWCLWSSSHSRPPH